MSHIMGKPYSFLLGDLGFKLKQSADEKSLEWNKIWIQIGWKPIFQNGVHCFSASTKLISIVPICLKVFFVNPSFAKEHGCWLAEPSYTSGMLKWVFAKCLPNGDGLKCHMISKPRCEFWSWCGERRLVSNGAFSHFHTVCWREKLAKVFQWWNSVSLACFRPRRENKAFIFYVRFAP